MLLVLWMSGDADGIKVVGIPVRAPTSSAGQRPAASSKRGRRPPWSVVESIFELDHMVPAVSEAIEIMHRLSASLVNDIAKARVTGIDGMMAKIPYRDQTYLNLRQRGTRKGVSVIWRPRTEG